MITPSAFVRRLRHDKSGLALLEFAFALPIFMIMALTGAEMTNYITTKMRASQLALQLADNAARMGNSTSAQLQVQISEADINDLFTGAQLQSGEMDLTTNGRVILSSLEPVASPNTTSKYKIRWQRCFGLKTHPSTYGAAGDTNLTGMGPLGPPSRQVTAQDDNATMFVELYYVYKPLIGLGTLAPNTTFTEIASMAVRDRRDLSDDSTTTNLHPNGIYKVTGVTASTC
jgi:Flp pilus assembly protein TadG